MLKIITGKAKGIRLKTLEGDATRPTSERVKEAVFSMLMGDIEDRVVLDLFSGSGQMSLEALSRGASRAVMVDKSNDAIKVITENSKKTKLDGLCDIRRDDCLAFLQKNRMKFDLIFVDPPYASGLYRPIFKALLQTQALKPTTLIICESGEEQVFGDDAELASSFSIVKQSRYSKTFITIFSVNEVNGNENE